VLIALGYWTAGSFGDHFWGLLLGIGLLCGLGVAFGYITALATAAKWFPERRGLVTGLVVAGYGFAAILLSSVAAVLMARGWPVLRIFRGISAVYGPLLLLTGLTLSVPPGSAPAEAVRGFRRTELFRDRRFWRLVVGICCATYPGLALIGALKPIGIWHGLDPVASTAAVSALAVGNGLGRVSWGFIYDRIRSPKAGTLLLGTVCLSVLVFAVGGGSRWTFLLACLFLGFCYGGGLVVFASEASRIYGMHLMGSVYTVVLAGHGVAGIVAAPLTGYGVDLTGGYWPGLLLALGTAAAGLVASAWLTRQEASLPYPSLPIRHP
jgi:OFA family oxalate/formate antiporter-like MFS transporter